MLDAVPEESEEQEKEWDEEATDEEVEEGPSATVPKIVTSVKRIEFSEYPQAFSHWSYRYTNRQALICDLQGTLESVDGIMTFRLSDPVIHGRFQKHRHRHGRTDHGARGIAEFFKTHECKGLCRLLGLPRHIPAL
jgi:hypothetical protein